MTAAQREKAGEFYMGFLEMLRGEEPGPLRKLLHYRNKGQFGEYLLEYAVTSRSIPGRFRAFHNLYLPRGDGCAEIDVLLLHERGIFVFESKNYGGRISGGAADLYWTQTFPNGAEYPFYNPVRQNAGHIQAAAGYLKLPAGAFQSCAVFSERCALDVPRRCGGCAVLRRGEVVRWLKAELDQRPVRYTPEQLEQWAERLNSARATRKKKRQHIAYVRRLTGGT